MSFWTTWIKPAWNVTHFTSLAKFAPRPVRALIAEYKRMTGGVKTQKSVGYHDLWYPIKHKPTCACASGTVCDVASLAFLLFYSTQPPLLARQLFALIEDSN